MRTIKTIVVFLIALNLNAYDRLEPIRKVCQYTNSGLTLPCLIDASKKIKNGWPIENIVAKFCDQYAQLGTGDFNECFEYSLPGSLPPNEYPSIVKNDCQKK